MWCHPTRNHCKRGRDKKRVGKGQKRRQVSLGQRLGHITHSPPMGEIEVKGGEATSNRTSEGERELKAQGRGIHMGLAKEPTHVKKNIRMSNSNRQKGCWPDEEKRGLGGGITHLTATLGEGRINSLVPSTTARGWRVPFPGPE